MATSTAPIDKAMLARWNASTVPALVRGRRTDQSLVFDTLFQQIAAPKCPFPYVVFQREIARAVSQMSYSATEGKQIREIPWRFRVHAQNKAVSEEIANSILDLYENQALATEVGCGILIKYGTDWSNREKEDEWLWIVDFDILFDAPTNPGP